MFDIKQNYSLADSRAFPCCSLEVDVFNGAPQARVLTAIRSNNKAMDLNGLSALDVFNRALLVSLEMYK